MANMANAGISGFRCSIQRDISLVRTHCGGSSSATSANPRLDTFGTELLRFAINAPKVETLPPAPARRSGSRRIPLPLSKFHHAGGVSLVDGGPVDSRGADFAA